MDEQCQLVSFDWPGFGDSYRPAIPYGAPLLCGALGVVLGHLQSADRGQIAVLAAGYSASAALVLAVEWSERWEQLVLVAAHMARPLAQHDRLASEAFRLGVTAGAHTERWDLPSNRAVLKLMLRRHVWVKRNLVDFRADSGAIITAGPSLRSMLCKCGLYDRCCSALYRLFWPLQHRHAREER